MSASSLQPSSLDVPAAPVAATTPPPAMQYTPPQPAIADPPPTQQPVIAEATADASDTSAPPTYSAPPKARKASYSAKSSGTRYTVKKGESLWTIAQSHYGNGNKWKAIANANPQINPNKIQAGQTITLP
jgi:5'-nucleotidase / UDP-sugar diphosphatase